MSNKTKKECMKKETNQIIRTSHIRTILNHIDNTTETLILFDLDKTLIKPEKIDNLELLLAKKALKKLIKGISSIAAQEDAFVSLLEEENITMKAVEDETADIIKTIQNRGITTWCITARFPSLIDHTIKHLLSVDIDFSHSKLADETFSIATRYSCEFKHGIIFCGRGNNKGDILIRLLKKLAYNPEKIILIDDHLHNLTTLQDATHAHNIEFLGIHYDRLKPFDQNQFIAAWPLLLHPDET